jgi:hypothetical protein
MYGGRGIKVCKRWELFTNFLKDMGQPPKRMSLDRKNNNGNYTPKNCRWATSAQQAHNTRLVKRLLFRGQYLSYSEIATRLHISKSTVSIRVKSGWIPRAKNIGLHMQQANKNRPPPYEQYR